MAEKRLKKMNKKILIVGDCVGWAVDRCCFPIAESSDNIDYVYTDNSDIRFKPTGYTEPNQPKVTIPLMAEDYDIIHHHNLRALNMILHSKECLKAIGDKEVILTVHTERDEIDYKDFKRVDKIIACTEYNYNLFKKKGFKKVYYIPHAINEKEFPYFNEYPRYEERLGFVGRVVKHKRLREIKEAADNLKCEVWATGYVSDVGYWTKFAEGIKFHDFIHQKDLPDFMRNFTMLLAISEPNIEVGPLPTIECASLGIPIVTTPMGWALDNLKHEKSAYFIEQKDIGNLDKHIKRLLDNRELREKIRIGARKVIDNWRLEDYVNRHKEMYTEKIR